MRETDSSSQPLFPRWTSDPGLEALHTPHALFLTRVCLCAIGCLPLSHRMGELLLGGQWVAPHDGGDSSLDPDQRMAEAGKSAGDG